MTEQELQKLKALREQYQKLRNEKLATGIVIKTMMGDFEVSNQQVVTAVLDFLTREVNEQIRQHINDE